MIGKAWLIVEKDLRAELRSRDVLAGMAYFALLCIVIFNFALDLRAVSMEAVAPGILWVSVSFAGVIGLNRAFAREQERAQIEGLLLCPVDRTAIYFGKLFGNLIFMGMVQVVMVPLFAILFNLTTLGPGLILALALGTLGFGAVGTFFSALSVHTRTRELMLPVLAFPLLVPIIIAAVKAAGIAMSPVPFVEAIGWLNLMAAFDAIALAMSYMLFGAVIEE